VACGSLLSVVVAILILDVDKTGRGGRKISPHRLALSRREIILPCSKESIKISRKSEEAKK
jgi:hypothetical protein